MLFCLSLLYFFLEKTKVKESNKRAVTHVTVFFDYGIAPWRLSFVFLPFFLSFLSFFFFYYHLLSFWPNAEVRLFYGNLNECRWLLQRCFYDRYSALVELTRREKGSISIRKVTDWFCPKTARRIFFFFFSSLSPYKITLQGRKRKKKLHYPHTQLDCK